MSSDILRLKGMRFECFHGVLDIEQRLSQSLEIDIEIELDFSSAIQSDQLGFTIDCRKVYELTEHIVKSTRYSLIEKLADEIATAVLNRFYPKSVKVRVRKPQTPMSGFLNHFEIEIERKR